VRASHEHELDDLRVRAGSPTPVLQVTTRAEYERRVKALRVFGSAPTSPRRPLLVLGIYAIAVVALTWPLLPNARTHIAAALRRFHLIDTLQVAWINAHETRALASAPASFLDAGIYHPSPRTLFYGTASLGVLPYFAPTFLATGNPVLAIDLAFLLCVALTAWGIHLTVHRWTADHLAGGVAAWTFLMSRTSLWGFVSSAPLYAPLWYLPAVIHAAATPSLGGRAPWMLAVLLALQGACDPLYVAPAVLGPLAAIGLWKLRVPDSRADGVALLRSLAIAILLLSPIYAGHADVLVRNPDLGSQSVWAARAPATPTPSSSATPTFPLWLLAAGHVLSWWDRFTVPLPALALVAVGVWLRRREGDPASAPWAAWRHCTFWVIAALLWPLVTLVVPMLRGAARGGLTGLVALSLLVGLAFASCMRGSVPWRRAGATALVAGLLFVVPPGPGRASAVASFLRYPIQPAPTYDPAIRAALAGRRGPVLTVPAGDAMRDSIAQYLTIFHRRRLLNGYGSYFPSEMPSRLELVRKLPDAAALDGLRRETGVETIVVDARGLDPAGRRAWDDVLEGRSSRAGLRVAARTDDVFVFDLEPGGRVSADRGIAAPASP
jgi:hypothetical protein